MLSVRILLLLLGLNGAAAATERERVAIASFKVEGPTDSAPLLHTGLRGGLASGFSVVADDEVEQRVREAGIGACDTMICLRQLAEALKIRYVVTARVGALGANYSLEIVLVDPFQQREVVRSEGSCQVCNLTEANETLSSKAAALGTKYEATLPKLPSPALAAAVAAPQRDTATRPWRIAAAATWAAGLVSIVAGAALLGIDGSQRGYSLDGTGHVRVDRYDTVGGGAALTTIGTVAAIAGSVLWWRSMRARKPSNAAQTLAPPFAVRW
jgi:hypothetical protein